MRKTTRQILFFFFAGAFLVSAPLVVLYTAGYRLSLNNYRVLETGAIATSTSPRGATVLVDAKKESAKTPAVIQNILPHDTRVRFERAGYIPWEQTVPVSAGRTTYVSAVLFANSEPEKFISFGTGSTFAHSTNGRYLLILDPDMDGTNITLYDNLTRFAKKLPKLSHASTPYSAGYEDSENLFVVSTGGTPVVGFTVNGERVDGNTVPQAGANTPVVLVDNGKNVEIHLARGSTQTVLALLPKNIYTTVAFDDEFVVLKDERRVLTVVSLSGNNAVSLDSPAVTLSWLPDFHLLAWSDGIEVNSYDATTGERTFLTRQSDLITSLTWHPSGSAVLVGTSSHITAIDKEAFNNRVSTLLLDSKDVILNMWLDKAGKNLYIIRNVDGSPTLERRKLVQ
jgi:WD40 repeat protein